MTGTLVSTYYLAERLGAPGLRILDASWFMAGTTRDPQTEFAEGHIPGAVRFDLDRAAAPGAEFSHTLPSASHFATYAGSLGIQGDDEIVVYDAAGMSPSARAWWMFKVHGHHAVSVLDGGLEKWVREGRALETIIVQVSAKRYPQRRRDRRFFDLGGMEGAVANKLQIIDARPAGRFAGIAPEPRAGLRSGHIPSSLNLPWTNLVDAQTKTFLPPDRIEELFRDAGADPFQPVVCTCGSGVTACCLALALEHIGNGNVSVYDGSWTEWATRHP